MEIKQFNHAALLDLPHFNCISSGSRTSHFNVSTDLQTLLSRLCLGTSGASLDDVTTVEMKTGFKARRCAGGSVGTVSYKANTSVPLVKSPS